MRIKLKFFIIMSFIILVYFVNTCIVCAKTYPPCDLSLYGMIEIESGGDSTEPDDIVTQGEEGKIYTSHNSKMTSDMELDATAKSSLEEFDNNKWWKEGTATITYTIDAGPNGKISEITYSFYKDKTGLDEKVCQSQLLVEDIPDSEVVLVKFKINKGHLKSINLIAKYSAGINNGYVAGGGSGGITKVVKKALSQGEKMPINTTGKTTTTTTTASAGCINPDGTACDDMGKISSNNIEISKKSGLAIGASTVNLKNESKKIECASLDDLIDKYWSWIMILAPVALILLITVDFVKAIISSDPDKFKKSASDSLKRTISVVVLLMLPMILRLILGWFGIELCL